jgi:hypothetical protein
MPNRDQGLSIPVGTMMLPKSNTMVSVRFARNKAFFIKSYRQWTMPVLH